MAGLTKTQLEHAKTRIAAAKAAYIHRAMAAIGEEPDVREYDKEQQEAMVRTGVATLKPRNKWSYRDLLGSFTYVDTPEMAAARQMAKTWSEAQANISKQAETIEEKLLDELVMSPNGAAALERIAAAFAS